VPSAPLDPSSPTLVILEFIAKHDLLPWLIPLLLVGGVTTAKRAGSWLKKVIIAGLRGFPELHREFYDCKAKCAANKLSFQQATAAGRKSLSDA